MVTDNELIIKYVTQIIDFAIYCACGVYNKTVDVIRAADLSLLAMTQLGISKPTNDALLKVTNSKTKCKNDTIPIKWIRSKGYSRFTAHNSTKELSRDALMFVLCCCNFVYIYVSCFFLCVYVCVCSATDMELFACLR